MQRSDQDANGSGAATRRGEPFTSVQSTADSGGSGGSVLDSAPIPVRQAVDSAHGAVDQAWRVAQDEATQRMSSQVGRIADTLNTVSEAVTSVGQELRQRDQQAVAQYTDQAAGRIRDASEYLRSRSVGDLVFEAENVARRQPALVLCGAFALGLIAARVLKSPQMQTGSPGSGARSDAIRDL